MSGAFAPWAVTQECCCAANYRNRRIRVFVYHILCVVKIPQSKNRRIPNSQYFHLPEITDFWYNMQCFCKEIGKKTKNAGNGHEMQGAMGASRPTGGGTFRAHGICNRMRRQVLSASVRRLRHGQNHAPQSMGRPDGGARIQTACRFHALKRNGTGSTKTQIAPHAAAHRCARRQTERPKNETAPFPVRRTLNMQEEQK